MGEIDESSSLFNHIVGDMKTMGPLWEDLYVKASKFYGAVKQSAITADAFLDSFQKIADVTTNSKGATRDIGISFTKIVIRHRAIESKLKTYVGILADNFLTPLQESIDEWKKTCAALEKDHTKDYKRVKSDLKKASAEASKLKKKASKKIGKQEYTDQFRESMKLANRICETLENQEKNYLRTLMIDERSRAAQFFKYYQPVVEQEITLIAEIEQLQSIMEETTKQCANPTMLPEISEDSINAYKVPEYLVPGRSREHGGVSPPASPPIIKDRSLSISSNSSQKSGTLSRTATLPSNYAKTVLDPIPVSVPKPSGTNSISSSRSSFSSSSSSLEQANNAPVFDPVTLEEINHRTQSPVNGHHPDSHELSHIDEYINSDSVNIHKGFKTRTSWSSIETTDSSGVGSYNSLNLHTRSSHPSTSTLPQNYCHSNSSNESEGIEPDFLGDCDVHTMYPPPPMHHHPDHSMHMSAHSSIHQHQPYGVANDMKYATIDRSHFRRVQRQRSGSDTDGSGNKQRSNSVGESEEDCPDYKMNLPKNKMNTICARTAFPTGARPTVFQLFENQNASHLRRQLSPNSSPVKLPLTAQISQELQRRNSSNAPKTAPKPKTPIKQMTLQHIPVNAHHHQEPRPYVELEPEPATPGSFQAALQQKRMLMLQNKGVSIDETTTSASYL